MKDMRLVIISTGVQFLQMMSVGWYTTWKENNKQENIFFQRVIILQYVTKQFLCSCEQIDREKANVQSL